MRRAGAGRKKIEVKDETLVSDLLALVGPLTRGDPQSPLRWTCKSLRTLAEQLRAAGHSVSHVVVGQLLKAQGYSLQGNAKVIEGNQSPDRNAQFEYINATLAAALTAHQPVISVDTKKEMVGESGSQAGSLCKSRSTISWTPNSGAPTPMGCTTSARTRLG